MPPDIELILVQVLQYMESGRIHLAYNLLYDLVYPPTTFDISA